MSPHLPEPLSQAQRSHLGSGLNSDPFILQGKISAVGQGGTPRVWPPRKADSFGDTQSGLASLSLGIFFAWGYTLPGRRSDVLHK